MMLKVFISDLLGDRRGATAIEYGLLVSLIALGTMGAMYALGYGVNSSLNTTSNSFASATKG